MRAVDPENRHAQTRRAINVPFGFYCVSQPVGVTATHLDPTPKSDRQLKRGAPSSSSIPSSADFRFSGHFVIPYFPKPWKADVRVLDLMGPPI